MTHGFYREFEERHYAPRTTIKEMRKQYLPFLDPLIKNYPSASTCDIGCGRGEWLEIMNEAGFAAHGVDLDQGMLQDCRDRNLDVTQGEGIAHLANLPDNSQALVTVFHVVEHIEFAQLVELIRHAKRILVPGGMLILETPNPENLVVGTSNFYLDPTHQRPIPFQLLSFLVEYEGFARVETIRLQESKALKEATAPTLYEVLSGVSPDYAVIATKAGPEVEPRIIDGLSDERGLSLRFIAGKFDQNLKLRSEEVEAHYNSLRHQIQYLKGEVTKLSEKHSGDRSQAELLHEIFVTRSRLEYVENQNSLTFAHFMQEIANSREEIQSLRSASQQLSEQIQNTSQVVNSMGLSPFWIFRVTLNWIKRRFEGLRR